MVLDNDPCGKVALDQRHCQRRVHISVKLEDRLDGRGQIGDAAVLIRPFTAHDVEDVGQMCLFAIGFHPYPLIILASDLPGVVAVNVEGSHHPTAVYFYTVKNAVMVVWILTVSHAGVPQAAILHRRPHPVGFNDVQPEGVWPDAAGLVPLDQGKYISAHQPGDQCQLLHSGKIVHAGSVAAGLPVRPQSKFPLRMLLPLLCRLRRKAQCLPVNGAFQRQADADSLSAVGVDRAGRQGAGHIQHPAPLAQRHIVPVNILVGGAAAGNKLFQSPPGLTGPGLAIAAGLGAGAVRKIQFCALVLIHGPLSLPVRWDHCKGSPGLSSLQQGRQFINFLLHIFDFLFQIGQIEIR